MRTLSLILCAVLAVASEADPAVHAKNLWMAAGKAGDLWSCLQLESWARSRTPAIRMGSALGDSVLIGDPLFAWPMEIDALADLGDRIIVAAGDRAYVVAPDGRALQPSVHISNYRRHVIGYDGTVVGSVGLSEGQMQLVAHRISDGERTMTAVVPLRDLQVFGGGRIVADDGSAMAVETDVEDPVSGQSANVTVVVNAAGAAPKSIEIPEGLLGVGRGGAWFIGGSGAKLTLVVGDKQRHPSSAAVGPGLAACLVEGKAILVRRDGKDAPLVGGPALGKGPAMTSVGTWLVLASGSGAKAVSQGDLLGDGAGTEAKQPPTLAFWRWADLAADPAAKPVATMTGELSVATTFPASVWVWGDKQLDLIDLTGAEPRREPYLTSTRRIEWASSSRHCVRLHHGEGRFSLIGLDKRELWTGACSDIEVKRDDLALIHREAKDRHSWSLVPLSVDPAKRKEVHLELPDQEQEIRVSVRSPDLVVARADRSWWRSTGFDGKIIQTDRDAGPKAVPPPTCPEWYGDFPIGRFQRAGARVRGKAELPDADPVANLDLLDAWRIGGNTILLERSGRVLVSGRKRGEWISLPPVVSAERLALASGSVALVKGEDARVVAVIAPGPKLEARDGPIAPSEMPAGPWRLEGSRRFIVPKGKQYEWDRDRLGWRPQHLRSPDASGLFIVTPAVLIELDPAVGKLFGR